MNSKTPHSPVPRSPIPDPFSRRGSALLIVLGMLSFMVVSAVAFSIFMRQGRLPSSFLRQRILARQLVKAGLAHAMSDIDKAIGDDPYPNEYRVPKTGAGGAGEYLGSVYNWPNTSNRNYWRGRVFMGVSGDGYQDDDDNTHLKNTVSTFPLEGLAYIPPPLVNTVRYWARRSPAAAWKSLDYDSGRYAFTAVDVSDYLDINRIKANVMRDSSPENRISLGYLFENDAHTGWGALTPKAFDKKMKDLADGEFGRLVSLADFNLALSSDASGPLADCGFTSQFCEYIKSPPSGAEFYTDENQARMQKFITDSWYPASNTTEVVLSDTEVPVFRSGGKGIRDLPAGLLALMKDNTVSPVWNKIKGYLNVAERAALRDYVDEDNVPTSLALPTIERTPQLVGLMVKPYGFQPKISELTPPVVENNYGGDPKKRATKRVWKLEGFQNPQAIMNGLTVFPFKRHSGLSGNQNFPVQVLVRAYLVEEGRTFSETRLPTTGKITRPAGANDWRADNGLGSDAVGYISLYGTGFANAMSGTSEMATLVEMQPIMLNAANADNFVRPLFGWITVEQQDDQGVWSQIPGEEGSHYDTSRFGEVGNGNFYYLDGSDQFAAAGNGVSLKWQFFVWVRIMDGNNTVDMFPATMLDDQTYNGLNGDLGPLRVQLGGDAQRLPIVPIAGPAAFKLDQETFLGTANGHAPGDGDPGETLVAYCNDPRFNWAPEDWWFVEGGSGVNANEWFNKTKSYRPADRSDYRQSDLFQFVSNQGYLQSMGEIQFLPLVRRDYNDLSLNNEISGRFFRQGSQYDGVKRTGEGNAANQDVMWKTRWGFGNFADWDKGGDTHDAYRWGVVDGGGGAAVSPYADEDLFMAALANTPYDYIVAAEQEENDENARDLEQNVQYCFNARSSEARLEWNKLKEIAKEMVDRFASGDPWEEWEDWIDDGGIFGQSISDFHDVDRKFLFSYWKPCFANNQQLFLVFVRAEPTVIGGSSAGHTPSQLGARAVALVWRDAAGIASSSGQGTGNGQKVHKMRILFYHQFE